MVPVETPMLYDVKQLGLTNGYCGPFAAVAVTGKPWPEVRRAINRARGRRDNAPMRGLAQDALVAGLMHLGCKVSDPIKPSRGNWQVKRDSNGLKRGWVRAGLQRVTLEDFVLTAQPCEVWIVAVKNHYLVLHAGQIADNQMGLSLPAERWFGFERSRPGCWITWAIRVEAPAVVDPYSVKAWVNALGYKQ